MKQQHLLSLLAAAMLVFPTTVNAFAPHAPSFVSRHIGLEIVIDLDNEDGTALKMAPSNGTHPQSGSSNSTDSSSGVAVLEKEEGISTDNSNSLDAEPEKRKGNNDSVEANDGIQGAPRIHADLFESFFQATEDSLNEYELNARDLEEQMEDFAVLQEREGETITSSELYDLNTEFMTKEDINKSFSLLDEGESDKIRSAPVDQLSESEELHGSIDKHDQIENASEFLDTSIESVGGSDNYADRSTEEEDFSEDNSTSIEVAADKSVFAISNSADYKETERILGTYQDDEEIEISVEEAATRAIQAALAAATASIEMAEEVIRVASMPIEIPEEATDNETNNVVEEFPSLAAATVKVEGIRQSFSVGDVEEKIDLGRIGHIMEKEKITIETEKTLSSFDSVFQEFSNNDKEKESLFEKTAKNKAQFTIDDEITESLRAYMTETNATDTKTKSGEQKSETQHFTEEFAVAPVAIAKELSDKDNSQDPKNGVNKKLFNVLDMEIPYFEMPKINVPLMLGVHEYQVKKAIFMAKEGLSALGQGLAVVAKESVESGIQTIDKMNTTIIGNEDDMEYELALEKIERAGRGFAKLLGIFGGVVKDSVVFVADEMKAKQEQQRLVAEVRQEASQRMVPATSTESYKTRTTIDRDSAAAFAAIREKQLDDIKTSSKAMFSRFFDEIDTEKPKRIVKATSKSDDSPKYAAREELVKATSKQAVIDSTPFFAARETHAMK